MRWVSYLSSWSTETMSDLSIMLSLVLEEVLPRFKFIQCLRESTGKMECWGSLKKGVERNRKQSEK